MIPTPTSNPNPYPRAIVKRLHFRSAQQFASWAAPHATTTNLGDWGNVEARLKGLDLLREGDTTIVPLARALVSQFSEQLPSLRRMWRQDVAGPLTSQSRYINNHPLSALRLAKRTTFQDPLKIWLGVTTRADITQEQMTRRGAALVAFALALSDKRPVFITPYKHTYDRHGNASFISWDLRTSPMMLSELCSISDLRITRHVGLHADFINNPTMTDTGLHIPGGEPECRFHLGAAADDIWIGHADSRDKLFTDPVAWVKEHLTKYAQENN